MTMLEIKNQIELINQNMNNHAKHQLSAAICIKINVLSIICKSLWYIRYFLLLQLQFHFSDNFTIMAFYPTSPYICKYWAIKWFITHLYGYQGQLEQKHQLIGYKISLENIGHCIQLSRRLKGKVGVGVYYLGFGAGISTKRF